MKLVVFDLDDTLLNSKEEVSERNRQAILKCSQKGMKIGYITVRSPRKIKTFLHGLPCDCIAYYNGALIFADNKLIEENLIKYVDAINFINKVIEVAPNINIGAHFEPYYFNDKEIRNISTHEKYNLNSFPKYNFQRIRLVLKGYECMDLSQYISNEMQYHISVHKTAIITHKYAEKGKSLDTLIHYFGIEKEQTVSFGDDINDISMLKASGIGVAMGNAVSQVKDIADYITLSNDEDGVAEYIETYIL